MKRTITFAVTIATLIAAPAFAGNEGMAGYQPMDANLPGVVVLKSSHCESAGAKLPPAEQVAFLKSCLAEASSPANVKAAALQEKKAYCGKNVKNKALQGSEKESYITACMNNNEALAQFEQNNRGMGSANTDFASLDINNMLQKLTGFVATFGRTGTAGSQ